MAPIVAQLVGARPWDRAQARAGVRMGLWAVAVLVPPLALFFAMAEPLLRFTGQSPALAALAAPYVYALAVGLPFAFGFMVLRSFATALSRPRAPLSIVLAMIAINLLGNSVFVFGHGDAPALGLVGSGIASALANAGRRYDAVTFIDVLEHIPNPIPALIAARRRPLADSSKRTTSPSLGVGGDA